MAAEINSKAARPGLSLYANLLGSKDSSPAAPGTISRAPVVFNQLDGEDEGQGGNGPAQRQQSSAGIYTKSLLRSALLQIRLAHQVSIQKPKSKAGNSKLGPPDSSAENQKLAPGSEPKATVEPFSRTTLLDWAAEPEDEDVNGFQTAEKRQRGGRKKRKKTKEVHVAQNWDDIYDPSRPNSYEEYQNSDEKFLEIKEWKDKLYAHRLAKRYRSSSDGSSDDNEGQRQIRLSFAPPSTFVSDAPVVNALNSRSMEDPDSQLLESPGITEYSDYAPFQTKSELAVPQVPLGPDIAPSNLADTARRPLPPSVPDISRAPIRYNLPPPPPSPPPDALEMEVEHAELSDQEDSSHMGSLVHDAPRSLRPGQKGFAERLMSKYGWTRGSGLGATGTGIVNPLRVQVEKNKKKPDTEGGGFVGPGGRGKIIGGKKTGNLQPDSQAGRYGEMSEVVVLQGMIDGLDLDAEMERANDGGLLQEIGEECGDKARDPHRLRPCPTNLTSFF
ncbi:MAG: hypothetical protein Q9222_000352 [Ikaeria aurantiellina]